LTFQIKKRGGAPRVAPEFQRVGEDRIIGSTSWVAADGKRVERYQVLTIRDGKIADVQGCTSMRHAERFARRG
jgi:hypothetical protein